MAGEQMSRPKDPAWKGWSLQPSQEGQVANPNGCQRGQNKMVREAQTGDWPAGNR